MRSESRKRCRGFRVSLRQLLVLVTLFCVFFAWMAIRLRVTNSLAALESMGVFLCFNDMEDGSIRCRLSRFVGASNAVAAFNVKSDEAMRHIRQLSKLQELALSGDVTNDGLSHLAESSRLKTLHISAPLVTDEGLNHLARLTPN